MFDKISTEYDGDWQDGSGPVHAPRFNTIVELLKKHSGSGRVLDVGCGVGELAFCLTDNAGYVGVERSGAARAIALERNPALRIVRASAEEYEPNGERFDSVVFNEMLYYAEDPVGLVDKYARFLSTGGVIVCSVFQKSGRASLRRLMQFALDRRRPLSNIHCEKMVRAHMARRGWKILEDREVAIDAAPGAFWHVWVAKPDLTEIYRPHESLTTTRPCPVPPIPSQSRR